MVSRDVILREETHIEKDYFVDGPLWLLDVYVDYLDIDRLLVNESGQFFYVTTTPGIDRETSFNILYISNQNTCYFDLSAGERRFMSAFIGRVINLGTMLFKDFHTNGPMKFIQLDNSVNGLIYIENTNLKVTVAFSNAGTIGFGPKVSLTVENDAYFNTQKGWIKLSPGNNVTVPGHILQNFCFPKEDGHLEITSSFPDTMTLANYFGQTNKIFLT